MPAGVADGQIGATASGGAKACGTEALHRTGDLLSARPPGTTGSMRPDGASPPSLWLIEITRSSMAIAVVLRGRFALAAIRRAIRDRPRSRLWVTRPSSGLIREMPEGPTEPG